MSGGGWQREDSTSRVIYNAFVATAHPQQPARCQAAVSPLSVGGTRFFSWVRSKQSQCGARGGMTKMLKMSLSLMIPLGVWCFLYKTACIKWREIFAWQLELWPQHRPAPPCCCRVPLPRVPVTPALDRPGKAAGRQLCV